MLVDHVRDLVALHGIEPQKSKGQHFLIDEGIIDEIVRIGDVQSTDTVIEIGPGLGILTEALVRRAGRVVAIELDGRAVKFLRDQFATADNFELIETDILALRRSTIGLRDAGYKVIANIPYNITAPIIRMFLEPVQDRDGVVEPRPCELVLMVQQEVAQRLAAQPGEMSIIALATQLYADVEVPLRVARDKFWPVPAVDSAVIRLTVRAVADPVACAELMRLIRIAFAARRKQLHNNISAGLKRSSDEVKSALLQAGIAPELRAQDLSLDQWWRLKEVLAV